MRIALTFTREARTLFKRELRPGRHPVVRGATFHRERPRASGTARSRHPRAEPSGCAVRYLANLDIEKLSARRNRKTVIDLLAPRAAGAPLPYRHRRARGAIRAGARAPALVQLLGRLIDAAGPPFRHLVEYHYGVERGHQRETYMSTVHRHRVTFVYLPLSPAGPAVPSG